MTYGLLRPRAASPAPPNGIIEGLTGLLRREPFLIAVEAAVADAWLAGGAVAVVTLDIDRFGAVNGTFGRDVGDALLRAVGERIRLCTRARDLAARIGGDAFALIVDDMGDGAAALAVSTRMVEVLRRPFLLDGHSVVIGTSVGVAIYPDDAIDAAGLLRAAHLAVRQAKADGCGAIRRFVPGMRVGDAPVA
ncbi:GGDEF domain-containing protein [Roseomonas sp. HF4]|uniref:GGDEF domain-containing protein n=1 Tax=Roseomonas sp. HF4 TaxID=2562313 RepID=UPI0010C0E487|nr:GGDEF domain-containing protein [Roseomonas sp. HF4]